MSEGCLTEMEGFGILCDGDGWKRRFANFAFPKWTETEVWQFQVSVTDGNRDSVSVTDGNGISISIHFYQVRFPFSVFSVTPYTGVLCHLTQSM